MSVTINDILKLPSLHGAKVVSGHSGLHRVVTAISVLESINTDRLGVDFPGVSSHNGQEIMITGFMESKDDVEGQCRALRRTYQEGEVALILFYVGSILPQVDQRLLDLSNELEMPLIVMPEQCLELRYSDVITDVMEAILEDRRANTYFATEVIEQLSHLAEPFRTINSVLSILRDRTRCSIYLVDEARRILNAAEWPNRYGPASMDLLQHALTQCQSPGAVTQMEVEGKKYQADMELLQNNGSELTIVISSEKNELTLDWCKQIKYVLKTYINLWTTGYGLVDTKQLVNAIMHGEQEKIRRISTILKLNLSQFSAAYFFYHRNNNHEFAEIKAAKTIISDMLSPYRNALLIDVFDETVVVFAPRNQVDRVLPEILRELENQGLPFAAVTSGSTFSLKSTKEDYWLFQAYKKYIPVIYPQKTLVTTGELRFIKEAKAMFDQRMEKESLANQLHQAFFTNKQKMELIQTAEVFLLDAGLSVAKTAALLHVHQNTIKYRLKLIESTLGHKLSRMPEMFDFYLAAALHRLNQALE